MLGLANGFCSPTRRHHLNSKGSGTTRGALLILLVGVQSHQEGLFLQGARQTLAVMSDASLFGWEAHCRAQVAKEGGHSRSSAKI